MISWSCSKFGQKPNVSAIARNAMTIPIGMHFNDPRPKPLSASGAAQRGAHYAYCLYTGAHCIVDNPLGNDTTYTGSWEGVLQKAVPTLRRNGFGCAQSGANYLTISCTGSDQSLANLNVTEMLIGSLLIVGSGSYVTNS
jgi:hypothetical protein